MFDGPEHEGYRALCLQLNLGRREEDWRDGDVYAAAYDPVPETVISERFGPLLYTREMRPTEITPKSLHIFAPSYDEYGPAERDKWVWLPRLDQWLAILRNYCTGFCIWERPDGWDANPTALSFEICNEPFAAGTPEEAAARLWMEIMDKRDTP